jgi:hypothetical protein
MQLPQYCLRDQAFICLAGRYYVILDLLRDKYLCIERHQLDSIKHRIACPQPSTGISLDAAPPVSAGNERSALISELVESGLLIANSACRTSCLTPIPRTPTEVADYAADSVSLLRCSAHLPSFFTAARSANYSLKHTSIAHTVRRVLERKRRDERAVKEFSVDRARILVSVFIRLRPFYDRKYLCLFDSLALLDFLARYALFPTWVFGVQSEPFAAHCWIQQDGFLVNDTVERVDAYTPVMAV